MIRPTPCWKQIRFYLGLALLFSASFTPALALLA